MSEAFTSVKLPVKPLVPKRLLEQWQRHRYKAEQARYEDKPLNEVFAQIYEQHNWHRDGSTARHRAGPGSEASVTRAYEAFIVVHIVRRPKVNTLVDIGCDSTAKLVACNSEASGRPGVRFRVLDVTREVPPEGDVATVREVFQHFSNARISSALANLGQRFDRAVITESVPRDATKPNIDIASGYRTREGHGSGVFVELAPFDLQLVREHVTIASATQQLRATVVEL